MTRPQAPTPAPPRPTHRLWCSYCGDLMPHACRPDIPAGAKGLLWQCARCGRRGERGAAAIYTAERLP